MLMTRKRAKAVFSLGLICVLLFMAASAIVEGYTILPLDSLPALDAETQPDARPQDSLAANQQQEDPAPAVTAPWLYEPSPASQSQHNTIAALDWWGDSGKNARYYNIIYADPFTGDMYLFEAVPWGTRIECPEFIPELDGYTFGFWYDGTLDEIGPFEFSSYALRDITLWAYFFPLQEDSSALHPTQEEMVAMYEDKLSNLSIQVYSNLGRFIREGELITVQAELHGFEKIPTSLQWQYSPDGVSWYNASGGSGISYSFPATMESIHYSWRLAVSLLDVAAFF